WGDKKNVPTKDVDQRLAARNAASFVITVLNQGGFIKHGRSKGDLWSGKTIPQEYNTALPTPHLIVRPTYEDLVKPFLVPLNPPIDMDNFEERTICTIGRGDVIRNTMVVVESLDETTTVSRESHISINVRLRQDETWEYILYPKSGRRTFFNGNLIDTPQ